MEEIDLTFTPDDPMPPGIEEDDYDSERDILILEELLDNYSLSLLVIVSYHFYIPSFSRPPAKPPDGNTEQKVPIPGLMITLVSNQEKSLDPLSHRSLKIFKLFAKCSMMIHGKNIPILDVPLFYFYPLDQFKYGGELGQAQLPKTSASWEAPHAYHIPINLKTLCQMILSSKSLFPQLQLGIQVCYKLKENSRIEEEIKEKMIVHYSTILKDALPPKEKNPKSFTLPCRINNMYFDKALANLRASVSVMPYSTFTNLGLGKLAPTKLIIELADKIVKRPKGIAENVLVGIGLREQMELDLEARLMGDLKFGDFLELNDFNESLELNDHEMKDLDLEIDDGEIIDEPKDDIVKIRDDDEDFNM
uniref:Reverse transcriptase domain-containing protein n=1 Tax=Tanacetum cinerariifolium TaxID=118510 RepID=A0A6L2KMV2_TANCI|nr:hypothetical protein [Tanacetum cinerariifolium]